MKRKILILFTFFLFTINLSNIQAQQIEAKKKSLENVIHKISTQTGSSTILENKTLFEQFFIKKAYVVSHLPEEKMISNKNNFKELKYKNQQQKEDLIRRINEQKNINLLDFEFEILENQNNTYIIDEKLGFILVIYSAKRIIQDFNEFKTTKK